MTALLWGREVTQEDLDAIPYVDSRVELVDGAYAEIARLSIGETWRAERPFPVTIAPADLID